MNGINLNSYFIVEEKAPQECAANLFPGFTHFYFSKSKANTKLIERIAKLPAREGLVKKNLSQGVAEV
jgi:hypothetical protein